MSDLGLEGQSPQKSSFSRKSPCVRAWCSKCSYNCRSHCRNNCKNVTFILKIAQHGVCVLYWQWQAYYFWCRNFPRVTVLLSLVYVLHKTVLLCLYWEKQKRQGKKLLLRKAFSMEKMKPSHIHFSMLRSLLHGCHSNAWCSLLPFSLTVLPFPWRYGDPGRSRRTHLVFLFKLLRPSRDG